MIDIVPGDIFLEKLENVSCVVRSIQTHIPKGQLLNIPSTVLT